MTPSLSGKGLGLTARSAEHSAGNTDADGTTATDRDLQRRRLWTRPAPRHPLCASLIGGLHGKEHAVWEEAGPAGCHYWGHCAEGHRICVLFLVTAREPSCLRTCLTKNKPTEYRDSGRSSRQSGPTQKVAGNSSKTQGRWPAHTPPPHAPAGRH